MSEKHKYSEQNNINEVAHQLMSGLWFLMGDKGRVMLKRALRKVKKMR